MPKITINEVDLTSSGTEQTTSNAVFIPGYAIEGEINAPTLCESLDEFENLFGEAPYVFKSDHTLTDNQDNTYVFTKGSYEQSYIYAKEALLRGLPVVYTRVWNDNTNSWLATGAITTTAEGKAVELCALTSKQPGTYYENITYSVTPATDDTPNILVITGVVSSATKSTQTTETIYFTFNSSDLTDAKKYIDYKSNLMLYKDISSEMVNFTWETSNINSDTVVDKKGTANLTTENTEGDEFDPLDIYTKLPDILDLITDRNEYSIKFLTSGSYPTFNYSNDTGIDYSQLLIKAAYNRGDCVALIDAFPSDTQTAETLHNLVLANMTDSKYTDASNDNYDERVYGAMFTPAGYYTCSTVDETLIMPASFGYITAYATSIQNNAGWLAVAGATRGVVTNLSSNIGPKITQSMINIIQSRETISINPITKINPYGNLIWGNRTLKDNSVEGDLTAQSFLNIRCLLSELKKVIYSTAKGLVFEQNNDILWINFKAGIVPTLEQMVTGGGLSGYEIKRTKSTKKATLKAIIRLYAIEAVEDFEINIELADSEVTTVE